MNKELKFNNDFHLEVCEVSSSEACITFDPPDYILRRNIEWFEVNRDTTSLKRKCLVEAMGGGIH